MFANGSEYDAFMSENCHQCPMYKEFGDLCPIDKRILECQWMDREEMINHFPYEWMDKNGTMSVYTCRKRLGKKKRFWDADELPKIAIKKNNTDLSKIADMISEDKE